MANKANKDQASEELRAFLAEYPNGWERADEDEVAEIEALLAEALRK